MDDGVQETLLNPEAEIEEDLKVRIWKESKIIWRIALPSILSRISAFGTEVVTQSFVGHISQLDLAGFALVETLSVRLINGVLVSS